MSTEAVDRRVRRTRKQLRECLVTLLKQKKVQDITVRELTELADTGGVFHVQPRRVFGNRQNAAIAGALDAHEHDLFLGVDSEHLLAHGRHDGRAVVI